MKTDNLLQSKAWELFQKNIGKKRFRVENCLVIRNDLPKSKCYFYCPKGPDELNDNFIVELNALAKKEGAIFARIEPSKINTKKRLKKVGSVQPDSTLILSLEKSEDELASEMKQKTRYNLNLAIKKGVEIEKTTDPEKIDIFYNVLKETTNRDDFKGHPKEYYKKMLETLGQEGIVRLYLAKLEDKYIAANIVSFWGDTVAYLHGASSNEYRNVMAPYLLQWEAIKDAKSEGYIFYDFWGIAPNDNPRHKWAGVTRFKKGFGGEQVNYLGTFDLVFSKKWYLIYRLARLLNRLF